MGSARRERRAKQRFLRKEYLKLVCTKCGSNDHTPVFIEDQGMSTYCQQCKTETTLTKNAATH